MTTTHRQQPPKKKVKQVNCYCDAYTFTHRMHSGKCEGYKAKLSQEPEMSWQRRMEIETGMTQDKFSMNGV